MARVKTTVPLRGKIGNVTFYNLNGVDIAVAAHRYVRNPKTEAQMKQRIKLNNILNMYGCIKNFLRNNFEGVLGTRNAASLFRSHNLRQNPVWLTERQKLFNYYVLAPYTVSYGRLDAIEYTFHDHIFTTSLKIGDNQVNEGTTIQELTGFIRNNNSGWQTGDSLKILLLLQNTPANVNEKISNPVCIENLQFCNIDGHLAVKTDQNGTYAFAACHTRGEGMKVLASPQKLLLSDTSVYDYFSGEEAMTAALKSYKTAGYRNK